MNCSTYRWNVLMEVFARDTFTNRRGKHQATHARRGRAVRLAWLFWLFLIWILNSRYRQLSSRDKGTVLAALRMTPFYLWNDSCFTLMSFILSKHFFFHFNKDHLTHGRRFTQTRNNYPCAQMTQLVSVDSKHCTITPGTEVCQT